MAVFAAGVCSALVGVLVLAGWWFQVPLLKSMLPGLISMKPNTALAFVLAGTALALLSGTPVSSRQARAGQWLALLVTLIGALTLCEFALGWQLGIDELLFKDDPNAVATLIPGRMALSTAVGFVLLGLALLGIEWEPRRGFRPAELLALMVAAVSLGSLVEYGIGQPILYQFSQYTRMALNTAIVFIVLSAGVLLARPAQGVVGALRSGRISPWERAVYAGMGLALLGVLAGGAWFYWAQEQQVRREVEADLEAIARLKADQIVQWRAERLGDAAVLMGSQFFGAGVTRWLTDPQADLAEKILARFRAMQLHNRYSDVLLVDARGQVRLRRSGRTDALAAPELEGLATAFRTRQPVLSDLHTEPAGLPPHANLIAPLFQKTGADLQPIGAVVFEIEARQFLFPLIQSWPTASRSAETLLVSRQGESVLFLNELRHRSATAFKFRIPLTQQDVPAVMAALGTEGVFHGNDYRGVKVLSVLKRIPDTSWFMVVKVDEAEALAEWRFRAGLIVAVVVALVLALAAAVCMIWAEQKKYRALSESAAALRKANRAYRVLSEGNQALVRATDESALLQEVCRIVVEHGGYRFAWIGYAEQNEAKTVRPLARTGIEEGYLERLNVTWADTDHGRGPIGMAIRTGQPNVAQDILHDPRFEPGRAEALQRGYAASVALPLTGQGRTFGVLSIYATEAHAFDEPELKLLEELAGDVAFGIMTLRLRAEHERQEQALRATEVRYRRLFESAKDGILILDAGTGMIVDVNPFLIEMLGYSHEVFLGKKVWELGFLKDLFANQVNFTELQQKEYIRYEDMALETSAGRRIEVEFVSNVYLVNHQKVIQCNIRDISARKRAEQALELERQKLAAAFENTDMGFVLSDAQGAGIVMNKAALRFHGYASVADMHGKVGEYADEWELRYPDGRLMPFAEWPLPRAIRGDFVQNYETQLRNAKTGYAWICSFTAMPVRNRAAEVTLLVLTLLDITERKRAEEAIRELNTDLERRVQERTAELRENVERFCTLANNISQLAWMADAQGSIFWYNQRWFDYTGTTLEAMHGWGWQKAHHPDHVQRVVDKIKHCFATGEVWEDTFPLRGKDGQYRWFLSRAVPIRDAHGTVLRWFGTNTDITEHQRAEAALLKAHELLQRRAAELEVFNRAMVDREQRIIEMKEEVNALCQELGRAPEYPPVWKK